MHAFLSNLQVITDRQTSQAIAHTSSFVESKIYHTEYENYVEKIHSVGTVSNAKTSFSTRLSIALLQEQFTVQTMLNVSVLKKV